jgi:hypothetical protein
MNEIELTIKIKVTTSAALDDLTVKAIGRSVIDGAEQNMDSETTLDVTEMIAKFQTTVSLIDEPTLADDTANVIQ